MRTEVASLATQWLFCSPLMATASLRLARSLAVTPCSAPHRFHLDPERPLLLSASGGHAVADAADPGRAERVQSGLSREMAPLFRRARRRVPIAGVGTRAARGSFGGTGI